MCYFILSFWQFLRSFWVWLYFIGETEDGAEYKMGIIRVKTMVVYHFWAIYLVRKVGNRRWSSVGSSLDFTLAIANVSEYLDIFCQSVFIWVRIYFVGVKIFPICAIILLVSDLKKKKPIAAEHIGSLSLSVEVAVHMLNAQPKVCLGSQQEEKSIHFVCFPW